MRITSVRVLITGRVQGVWFRGWTEQQATRLNLSGWVKNRADGSVEALFSGQPENVDQMLDLCWQGPPMAVVSNVMITPSTPPERAVFQVLRHK